ncbi:hypothetical protein [Streptomyces albicerus]|uniref:hypothetical protein n=1 Tax=Streptomyces albicerus TaxID=2569859 RepID=UPI00298E3D1D|nr:hypothetical protein [Streptomyces albicerus]
MPTQSTLLLPARPRPDIRLPTRRPPRRRQRRIPLIAVVSVMPLYGIWAAFLATGGGDLAAQYAWAGFAGRHPDAVYGLFWYGGTHAANYSVLSPPLMALLGVRTVSVLAGLAATWWLAALLIRTTARAPLWPALLGALGLWGNVAMGRSTFALGLAFGLAGLLALAGRPPRPGRLTAAALGALLATLASPLAGLFVLVAGAGYLRDRQYAKCLALAIPPVAAVWLTTLLFPFQGEHPMGASRMTLPLLLAVAVAWAAPREWRVVRAGAVVYAAGVVLTWLIPSPVGSNVERLAVHLGPAVLLAALLNSGFRAVRSALRRIRTCVLVPLFLVTATWTTQSALHSILGTAPVPAWAAHTDGVIAELGRLGADRGRVEVVNATNHREGRPLRAPCPGDAGLEPPAGRGAGTAVLRRLTRRTALSRLVASVGRRLRRRARRGTGRCLRARGRPDPSRTGLAAACLARRVLEDLPCQRPTPARLGPGRRSQGRRSRRDPQDAARRNSHGTHRALTMAARRGSLRTGGRPLDPPDRTPAGRLSADLQLYGRAVRRIRLPVSGGRARGIGDPGPLPLGGAAPAAPSAKVLQPRRPRQARTGVGGRVRRRRP